MLIIKGGQTMPQNEIIPSPSFGINYVLGGGFWTGRFSLLWGNYSSGKTTFLLHTLANAQEMGYTPVIVDSEGSYTDQWGEKCGLDLDKRIWMKSNIVEAILKELKPMMQSNIKYAILLDSVNAVQSENYFDDKGGMASGARSRSKLLNTISEYLHPEKNIVLAVAQQTLDLSGNYPRISAKLGNAEDHLCTNIIRLFGSSAKDKLERVKENSMIVNKEVTWTMQKCKQAPVEGIEGHYWFSPQNAYIDNAYEILDIAVLNDVVNASGAWFKYGDDKFHGFAALRKAIEERPDMLESIRNEVMALSNIQLDERSSDD